MRRRGKGGIKERVALKMCAFTNSTSSTIAASWPASVALRDGEIYVYLIAILTAFAACNCCQTCGGRRLRVTRGRRRMWRIEAVLKFTRNSKR